MAPLLLSALSLGVACASEPAATPDVPTLSKGEAIGLVQAMLRESREMATSMKTCSSRAIYIRDASYLGEGKWEVSYLFKSFLWHVYEGSNAVQTVKGKC